MNEAELIEIPSESKDLDELKSRFISIASHEFKTPLAGILSSIQLIRRYTELDKANWSEVANREKIEKHYEYIEESVNQLNLILESFLSAGKLSENRVQVRFSNFLISSHVKKVIGDLKCMKKYGQRIEYTHHGLDEIFIDYNLFRIVLSNIISNAIKYSGDKGLIKIETYVTKDNIYVSVEDNGIGIPENEQDQLFTGFYRAKNADHIEGSGLGLYIVKNFTQLLNGEVSFRSKENEGTEFNLRFKHYKQDKD